MVFPAIAAAADSTDTDSGFSVQVSPSPLVATIKPGEKTTLDLQIRNNASHDESLKMELRTFTVDSSNGKVDLEKSAPKSVTDIVSFSAPQFSISAGQIFSQQVRIDTPATAGFTYTFAIVVAQQNPPKAVSGRAALSGSVAIFTLLSVDRPGATSKLELTELKATKRVYEFLPATFDINFKNSGNTLIQPRGTVFIQRHSDDAEPLATIQLNEGGGYILPNSSRTLTASWADGFPVNQKKTAADGTSTTNLSWKGGDFSKLRIGRYTAKVVAVYNDDGRDVPLQTEVTFWVIPWRILGGIALVVLLVMAGLYSIFRQSARTIRHKSEHRQVKRKNAKKSNSVDDSKD